MISSAWKAVALCAIAGCFLGCASDDPTPGSNGGPPTVAPPANIGQGGAGGAGLGGVGNPPPVGNTGGIGTGTAGVTAPPNTMAGGGVPPMGGGGAPMAGAGAGGTPAGGAGAGGGGVPPVTGGKEPTLPTITETCPTLATGMVSVLGQQVQLWVGSKSEGSKGPVFFYWHGTGSRSTEASGGLGSAIQEITAAGGLVASFTTTTGEGMNTGNNVWYTGDFKMADILLVCATQQLNIETKRIYTGGCSAGGLQAGAMLYGRSSYLAGAMPNSGGVVFGGQLEASGGGHVPALITTHGAMGTDVVGIDFATTSMRQCMDVATKGGVAVDCDHGGRHCGSPAATKTAQWQFLKDHPFGAEDPYKGTLPASFPAFCKIIM